MSKKIGFPVLSVTITGVLYIVALFLGTLTLFVSGLATSGVLDAPTTIMVNGLLFFIGALLAALALISYALHPDLEEGQRFVFAVFLVLLILLFFEAGVTFSVSF